MLLEKLVGERCGATIGKDGLHVPFGTMAVLFEALSLRHMHTLVSGDILRRVLYRACYSSEGKGELSRVHAGEQAAWLQVCIHRHRYCVPTTEKMADEMIKY